VNDERQADRKFRAGRREIDQAFAIVADVFAMNTAFFLLAPVMLISS
jgi:hypothetical protein